MKNVLGIAGSNSSTSINGELVKGILASLNGVNATYLNLAPLHIPMYNIDAENESGIPQIITSIQTAIQETDAIVIAVNEHNGSISAFFKNIVDWLSRADRNFLEGTPILLMSTSPGGRGGKTALAFAQGLLPKFGGNVVEAFSFPSFQENFKDGKITNPTLEKGIAQVCASFLAAV